MMDSSLACRSRILVSFSSSAERRRQLWAEEREDERGLTIEVKVTSEGELVGVEEVHQGEELLDGVL